MIREAKIEDCINLAALSLEVWLQTYSIDGIRTENSKYALSTFTKEYFENLLSDRKYKILVFIDGIYLRGYVLINLESRYESEDNGFEIEKLYVHGAFQGQKIGSWLLDEVRNRFGNRFWLYTWVRNKSIGFYKKFGFQDVGVYCFYFGDEIVENKVLIYSGKCT